MAVKTKKKTPRKVILVRIVCIAIAVLMVVPLLISSIISGTFW